MTSSFGATPFVSGADGQIEKNTGNCRPNRVCILKVQMLVERREHLFGGEEPINGRKRGPSTSRMYAVEARYVVHELDFSRSSNQDMQRPIHHLEIEKPIGQRAYRTPAVHHGAGYDPVGFEQIGDGVTAG